MIQRYLYDVTGLLFSVIDCEMIIPAFIINYIRYLQELYSFAQLVAQSGRS